MIHLDNVTKFRMEQGRRKDVVLKNFSAIFKFDRNIGILCETPEIAVCLTNTFYGSDQPNKGRILRQGGLAWPLGYRGLFHKTMTGYQNIRFVADLFDRDPRQVLDIVEDVSEIGGYLEQPFGDYLPAIRTRFRFALWYAMKFDCYLIGNFTSVGDAEFSKKTEVLLKEMSRTSCFIVISDNPKPIVEYCDRGAILQRGKMQATKDLNDLVDKHFTRLESLYG
jgi:capsular polysaccharide transport system ATP-binding protein